MSASAGERRTTGLALKARIEVVKELGVLIRRLANMIAEGSMDECGCGKLGIVSRVDLAVT
jgi:hypothetical protein